MKYGAGQTPVPVGPDGVAVISRDASVVFDADTLASWVGKPITIGHPKESVTVDNWSTVAHGHIENARRGDPPYAEFMVGDVLVTHPPAIKLAEDGCEISGGYDAAYAADGVGRGRQTKIVGNHLAFLPDGIKGRCGEMCYVGDQSMDIEDPKMTDKTGTTFASLLRRLSGAKDEAGLTAVLDQVAAEEAHAAAIATKDAEITTLKGQVTSLTEQVAKLTKDDKHEHKFGDDGKCECGAKKPTSDGLTLDAAAVTALHGRVTAAAEILSPGFKVGTLDATGDLAKTVDHLCGCQKQALEKAFATDSGKKVIEKITGLSPDFGKMTADQIDARFFAVADLMAAMNNTSLTELMAAAGASYMPAADQYAATAAADKRSRERWGKDKPAAAAK